MATIRTAIITTTQNTMEIFKSKTALKDEVTSLTAQLESSEGENETLGKQIETLQAEIITKDETISTDAAKIATLEESNGGLNEQVAELTANLETANKETEDAEATTSAKAVEIVASAGHTEAVKTESEEDNKNSSEGLYSQYKQLQATNPAAAGKFWKENKSAMLAKK